MWSDTLLLVEKAHLLRLLLWGGASVLIGTLLILLASTRASRSALLTQFGIQSAGWGVVEVAIAIVLWRQVAPRDAAAASRLNDLLWLNCGLDVGYVAVGITLIVAGWILGRRLGAVGAGVAVVIQGFALLLLDAVVLNNIMLSARNPI